MNALITVAQLIVSVAAALCVARLVLGPSLADRAVAADTLLLTIGMEIALGAAKSESNGIWNSWS